MRIIAAHGAPKAAAFNTPIVRFASEMLGNCCPLRTFNFNLKLEKKKLLIGDLHQSVNEGDKSGNVALERLTYQQPIGRPLDNEPDPSSASGWQQQPVGACTDRLT